VTPESQNSGVRSEILTEHVPVTTVTAELEVFRWQRVLRQAITADTKHRTLRCGVCYHDRLTVITRSQQRKEVKSEGKAHTPKSDTEKVRRSQKKEVKFRVSPFFVVTKCYSYSKIEGVNCSSA
jgi:uncharacterized Fe-S cluster-containing radical SAM superfamily protein